MTGPPQAPAALNGWSDSDVGCVNVSVRSRVISTVRVPTCASSSLHSCWRAAISLSLDSSASACWARSRARWRANALLYCSAEPGLIREGELTCERTKRNCLYLQIKKPTHCVSLLLNKAQKVKEIWCYLTCSVIQYKNTVHIHVLYYIYIFFFFFF